MNTLNKIGRNDLCPCGSGKKYKKCHGTPGSAGPVPQEMYDNFKINKEIAYKGKIGKEREAFCIDFINRKQTLFAEMKTNAIEKVSATGKTLSCSKGCSDCCSMHIEASVQECEAIVYYLYHHDLLYKKFLADYPQWREKVRNNGDLHKRCGRIWNTEVTSENTVALHKIMKEEAWVYYQQHIPCPFLVDRACSIYQVRPFICAGYYATTQPELCRPEHKGEASAFTTLNNKALNDISFYHKNLEGALISFMPICVYEILKTGVSYYSLGGVSGFVDFATEFYNDPEVAPMLNT